MRCPYCGIDTDPKHYYYTKHDMLNEDDLRDNFFCYSVSLFLCTSCYRGWFDLERRQTKPDNPYCEPEPFPGDFYQEKDTFIEEKTIRLYPPADMRQVDSRVPEEYKKDFQEASLILNLSPKGSAALLRRCLQNLIQNYYGIQKANLSQEIDELINSKKLSATLNDDLHEVRIIGNFSAHPKKDTSTGEIIEVEKGEAEYLLYILEDLFYETFVAPVKAQERKDSIKAKIAASK